MAQGILVAVNQEGGHVRRVAYEMLSVAQELAPGAVTAVTFGDGAEKTRDALGQYGADTVVFLSQPAYHRYSSDGFAQALKALVGQIDPAAIFFPATSWGRDLAPRVAGEIAAGLASDCTEVFLRDDGRIGAVRPIYAGKAYARVAVQSPRQVFSLRPNIQRVKESGRAAHIMEFDPGLVADSFRARVTEVQQSQGGQLELTEADIIVSGGRGVKAPENFAVLEDLAQALGAALGSSRPVADEGWVPHSYHIGQTGKVVSPTMYVAVGISGAIQHLAGISGSKYIVAINSDADAPIFKAANYGIVGDLFQVVPAFAEAVRDVKKDT